MEMSSIESENGARTILDKATEIRERDMSNWEPYVRTKIITQQEASLVSSFDKNKLGRKEQIEKDGVATMRSLLKILAGISKADVLQYTITLLDDLLEEDETRVNLLLQAGQTSDSASWVPFMRILEKREDAYLMMQAARMIGRVVAAGEKLQGREFKFFTQWLRDTIMRKASDSLDLALAVAIKILQRPDNRVPFMNDGLAAILGCINNSESKVQSQYMAVMCLWLLSFDETVAARLGIDEPRLISDVAHVLRSARKEKLARVCVALFKNLLSKPTETSILSKYKTMMVGQKLMPLIDTFVNQKPFNDEELIEDSQFIAGKLHECFEQMSTFDEYASEVKSGELEWSPVHKSARFWKDNVLRLNDNNYELLRLLVQIMESSDNKEHLAIAAHDIGEYVRYNPRGKSVIDSLDGKTQIMKLMLHADMSVKYEALLALQKIMTNNWEYLGEKVKEAVEN